MTFQFPKPLLALVAALPLVLGASAAVAGKAEVIDKAISNHIVIGYERLEQWSELGHLTLQALCAEPSAANLERARERFAKMVEAFARIETVRFGPIVEENRLERILFFPDRRGIGLRQVQAILASKDETATDLASLKQKSVAVQGLGALEFVLYGTGAEALVTEQGDFRCRYGAAVAGAIHDIAATVRQAWEKPEGIADRMRNPAAANRDYRTQDEVMRELLGVWVHGAELIRDVRIAPFLGVAGAKPNHKTALFWRSGLTIDSIAANAAGMRDLFVVSGMADILPGNMRWIAGSLDFEFRNFARTAAEIDRPLEAALADSEMRGRINYLLILTKSVQNMLVTQVGAALGLSAGFSALDGD